MSVWAPRLLRYVLCAGLPSVCVLVPAHHGTVPPYALTYVVRLSACTPWP